VADSKFSLKLPLLTGIHYIHRWHWRLKVMALPTQNDAFSSSLSKNKDLITTLKS
jgi:hypothetical protein